MSRPLAIVALVVWAVACFTVPLVPALAVGVVTYFLMLERANSLTDDYLDARAAASPDPFGPRPLRRPWYADRNMTGMFSE
jgi:hypothetical protein